jgi:hypothetical protein
MVCISYFGPVVAKQNLRYDHSLVDLEMFFNPLLQEVVAAVVHEVGCLTM